LLCILYIFFRADGHFGRDFAWPGLNVTLSELVVDGGFVGGLHAAGRPRACRDQPGPAGIVKPDYAGTTVRLYCRHQPGTYLPDPAGQFNLTPTR
jgi:hypothetical protein